jgi:hypothetical protein
LPQSATLGGDESPTFPGPSGDGPSLLDRSPEPLGLDHTGGELDSEAYRRLSPSGVLRTIRETASLQRTVYFVL